MSNPLKAAEELFKAAALNWMKDYAQSMGAALAFHAFFSIAPLLMIVVAVAGFVFGEEGTPTRRAGLPSPEPPSRR